MSALDALVRGKLPAAPVGSVEALSAAFTAEQGTPFERALAVGAGQERTAWAFAAAYLAAVEALAPPRRRYPGRALRDRGRRQRRPGDEARPRGRG